MRALRNLLNELVERRLWPVALLLVLALAAVPLLLSKPASSTGDDPSAATPAQAQAAAAAAARPPGDPSSGGEPVVAIAQSARPTAPLRGRLKNPFRQQHVQATTETATAPPAGPVTSTGDSGSSPGGGSGDDSGGDESPQPQKTYTYASIDVRFGKAGRPLHAHDDVPRLTPLPGPQKPIVVFMGMRADHETAVFLVSTDVHAQGEGRCVPSRKECAAIELRRGQIALLDWSEPDGSVAQYELALVDVTLHETTSKAVARRAYARTSADGERLLGGRVRSSAAVEPRPGPVPFRYAARRGILHIKPWASRSAGKHRARGGISGGRVADLPPGRR